MQTLTQTPETNFVFKTTYMGHDMNLYVVANEDKYSVLQNDKPIGHIKLGNGRHTWIVVDSKYIAPQLVNEIAKRIASAVN